MYNRGLIASGLALFVLLVSFPFWFNVVFSGRSVDPKVEPPPGGERCRWPVWSVTPTRKSSVTAVTTMHR